jgi:hypothetical protein
MKQQVDATISHSHNNHYTIQRLIFHVTHFFYFFLKALFAYFPLRQFYKHLVCNGLGQADIIVITKIKIKKRVYINGSNCKAISYKSGEVTKKSK